MPRRKPHSHKEKKAKIQVQRAVKRGDSPPPVKPSVAKKKPGRSAFAAPPKRSIIALETKFLALPKGYAEATRNLAWSEPLPRPLPPSSAVFDVKLVDNPAGYGLSVPARPKFRLDMTKTQLEKNEEGLFKKWLEKTGEIVHDWVDGGEEGEVRSPNWFETNLEVWRQLWRVNEASNLILLLVDSRCPPVHCPPSLRTYLKKQKKEVIIVLTKADLVDPGALEGWKKWMKEWWAKDTPEPPKGPTRPPAAESKEADEASAPEAQDGKEAPAAEDTEGDETPLESPLPSKPSSPSPESSAPPPPIQVVSVTSYDLDLLYAEGKRKVHKPLIGDTSRLDLLDAIKTVHERLLQPPAWAQKDPAKLAEWKPPMRRTIDWDSLSKPAPVAKLGKGTKTKEERARERWQKALRQDDDHKHDTETEHETEKEGDEYSRPDPSTLPLTIGLIGQPNVGKSSLLNALLGSTRVRASKTPGKTKHFQTIFWGSNRDIKIVDCPGLVCPSLVPMEIQAMAGVLPISQIPSLPSCIHYAGDHLPLETIFKVPLPQDEEEDHEAKKTWREDDGRERQSQPEKKRPVITAGDIMEARAADRGFVTAKGGRPDTNRAANGMMRALADGRVRWGFWPEGGSEEGKGIWLDSTPLEEQDDHEHHSGDEGEHSEDEDEEDEEEESEDEESEDEDKSGFKAKNNAGFFAALDINDDEDDEEEESDEE